MNPPALSQWIDWSRGDLPGLRNADEVKERLKPPTPLPAHVGLFLDRCLIEPVLEDENEHPGRLALYRAAVAALCPETPAVLNYQEVFARWQELVLAPAPGVLRRTIEVRAESRILLHPETAGTVTESALLLHHTYGVPYLPGSALKGLCRSTARRALQQAPAGVTVADLFGDAQKGDEEQTRAGLFDFWDALWVPDGALKEGPLQIDVVNPHHVAYYTQENHPAPTFSDDPQPTHFLTVRPGARFLLVVEAADSEGGLLNRWLEQVMAWLSEALREQGLGAKTSAGYGRLAGPEQAADPGSAASRTAAKRATAAQPAQPVRDEILVYLLRNKSDGSLVAVAVTDRSVAGRAQGAAAKQLHEGLLEETRRRLDRGKEVRVRVLIEVEGNLRRIVAIPEG